ncbi:MAG: nucleotide sugar dehydrogenase [Candidatus Dormibacteria bacterium]
MGRTAVRRATGTSAAAVTAGAPLGRTPGAGDRTAALAQANGRPQPAPVCVIGAGYVGLATAAILAERGHHVRLAESAAPRLELLRRGTLPIHEPGLTPLVQRAAAEGTLEVHGEIRPAAAGAEIIVVAVGTAAGRNGRADLRHIRDAVAELALHASVDSIVVIKSTVPPGTTAQLQSSPACRERRLRLVACPEFLREGTALDDSRHPSRVVVGGEDPTACALVAELFGGAGSPTLISDSASAELIKYSSNAFLALKISFINEIAHLCEQVGADIVTVAEGTGADPRIGRSFMDAGLGFGGSCLPKDVRALENLAGHHGHSFGMLRAAMEVNFQQRRRVAARVEAALGGSLLRRRVAVLGLAFKPDTDDVRDSPAIELIDHLADLGAMVTASDPVARGPAETAGVRATLMDDPYECVRGAEAVVVATEWACYRSLGWDRAGRVMANRYVFDARNCLEAENLRALGFEYCGIGRPPSAGG